MIDSSTIVGHETVRAALRAAVDADRLHHALLFEGPEGIGKRALAFWLAQLANCAADDTTARPCGGCGSCKRIAAGNHPDVLTLGPDPTKASSTIPVESVREIVRVSAFHRFDARKRFVIVDPAEELQAGGANALLKTLEEPPEGTHFVLIASSPRALLPTVLSRCQRTRLRPLEREALTAWLEARGVEEASTIALLAQGAPSRALAFVDGGLAARRTLRANLFHALAGDLHGVFSWSESLTKGPRQSWTPAVEDVLGLVEELLRDVVVLATGGSQSLLHGDCPEVVHAWTTALWQTGIPRCSRALQEARLDLARNVSGKTALDALLTRLATELGPARKAGQALAAG